MTTQETINDIKIKTYGFDATAEDTIKTDGSVPMAAALDMGSFKINNVLAPAATTDAANKSYVDTSVQPASKRIVSLNTKTDNTGSTTENTVFTGTIPGGSIGVNGSFHIISLTSYTNNANTKTYKVKFNGTIVSQWTSTTNVSIRIYSIVWNRNSLSAQVSAGVASGANATFNANTATAPTTFTFDTSADITVTITIQNASGADTASMEAFEIIANY